MYVYKYSSVVKWFVYHRQDDPRAVYPISIPFLMNEKSQAMYFICCRMYRAARLLSDIVERLTSDPKVADSRLTVGKEHGH